MLNGRSSVQGCGVTRILIGEISLVGGQASHSYFVLAEVAKH